MKIHTIAIICSFWGAVAATEENNGQLRGLKKTTVKDEKVKDEWDPKPLEKIELASFEVAGNKMKLFEFPKLGGILVKGTVLDKGKGPLKTKSHGSATELFEKSTGKKAPANLVAAEKRQKNFKVPDEKTLKESVPNEMDSDTKAFFKTDTGGGRKLPVATCEFKEDFEDDRCFADYNLIDCVCLTCLTEETHSTVFSPKIWTETRVTDGAGDLVMWWWDPWQRRWQLFAWDEVKGDDDYLGDDGWVYYYWYGSSYSWWWWSGFDPTESGTNYYYLSVGMGLAPAYTPCI
eukprot:scaffold236_cov245-Amphora_coffeaeformis.AAC.4